MEARLTSGDMSINIPVEIATSILDSYRTHLKAELIERSGDPHIDARRLFELDAVVLSHNGGDDPKFVYANAAAAAAWRTTPEDLIGMPSRLSAPPEHRESRKAMLDEAARDGYITGYSGTRVARDGSLFIIKDATLWSVHFPDSTGQAVVFRSWVTVE
jgi:PAS domain-containing protein